jgi:hypothetical protein
MDLYTDTFRPCLKLILVSALLISCSIYASEPAELVAENNKVVANISPLTIPHVNLSAQIDGDLSDDIWQQANSINLNIVNSPWDNKPSPVKTTAKIVENGEYLYIAFIAQDPNPEDIIGSLGDRDTRWGDDLVVVKLDTYNNRRLNYEFYVNSLGVQIDSIKNEMTGTSNSSWDGIWDSYGIQTEKGYQVEIAIPYRILNFDDTDDIKTWAIELVRIYPRDTALRISHIPLNRDNNCYLCQAPDLIGFKHAKAGKNIMVTPAIVANRNDTRDIYDSSDDWQEDNQLNAGVDLRWGISSNTLLNATINPDFSTVESDLGQLSVNKTFSLYYQEKRPFFLENVDYFASDYDLIYTRNIADPDYGAKLTGTEDSHNYGIFVSHDNETNFILPSNTSSTVVALEEESHSAALRYRYDVSDDLSLGTISTVRSSDNYHNYVVGVDSNYRINDSNSIKGQFVNSSTEHNAIQADDFSDHALKLSYQHNSEYWQIEAIHKSIGKDFRADLGFIPRTNMKANTLSVNRLFYGDNESRWQQAKILGRYQSQYSQNDELLEKSFTTGFEIDGPMLSLFDITLVHADKVGLREDLSNPKITNNSTLFTENQINLFGNFQPTNQLYASLAFTYGDKIDFDNNRLGDYREVTSNITYNFNQHLELDLYLTRGTLDFNGNNVYVADLAEVRVSYQFDVQSYLKLNVVYINTDRNLDNNTNNDLLEKERILETQLIYAYKLNPQTVFFLGYSDSSYQDDYLPSLEREQRTFFSKVSYAWIQ